MLADNAQDKPRWICYPPAAGKRMIRVPWPETERLYYVVLHVDNNLLWGNVVSFYDVHTNHSDLSYIFNDHSLRELASGETLPTERGYYSCKLEYSFTLAQDQEARGKYHKHHFAVSEVHKLPADYLPPPSVDWSAQLLSELPTYLTDAELNKVIAERERAAGDTGNYREIEVLQSVTFTNKRTAFFGEFERWSVDDLRLVVEFLGGTACLFGDDDLDNIVIGGAESLSEIIAIESQFRANFLYEPKIDDALQEFDLGKDGEGQMDALVRLAKAKMASGSETHSALIWWLSQESTEALSFLINHSPTIPLYLVSEFNSRKGRSGRCRLWVADEVKSLCNEVVWNDLLPICKELEQMNAAGIVIRAKDREAIRALTTTPHGIFTTPEMVVIDRL